ncbi:MAG: PD-(D/E)XK nuclease family protein, partial [Clostridia bacterium]|nr:PD-(D/E)XK nuclease family protein [Clostridia bacterium]
METRDENKEKMEALKAFLLDISCLDPLSEWTNRFNLFDVLKISHYEIRHSNFLAWLLNPKETHGLGSIFLEEFIKHTLDGLENKEDIFRVLLMDLQSFTVFREWHNIDILAVSENEKAVICIENKYGSKEHGNQLHKYYETVLGSFPKYKKIFVFLSPDGMESSNPEHWYSISYEDILSILQSVTTRTVMRPEVEMLINQYKESVGRDIMQDEKLEKICREIYAKHQRALDLLFENRPDKMSEIAGIFREWARAKMNDGILTLDEDHSNKINTRIKTIRMDEIIPDISIDTGLFSSWGTRSSYYYEIQQDSEYQYRIALVANSKNMNEKSRSTCKQLYNFFNQTYKDNWLWKTFYTTKKRRLEDASKESIFVTAKQSRVPRKTNSPVGPKRTRRGVCILQNHHGRTTVPGDEENSLV